MVDLAPDALSVLYALILVLPLTLAALALKSRRSRPDPAHRVRSSLLAVGMTLFALQGLYLLVVTISGGVPSAEFILISSGLEVLALAFLVASSLQ